MADAKGFNITVYDGASGITISNTCKSGYITFYSNKACGLEISVTEEQFVNLVKYMNIEAEKIKEKIEESKDKAGFTVESEGEQKNG